MLNKQETSKFRLSSFATRCVLTAFTSLQIVFSVPIRRYNIKPLFKSQKKFYLEIIPEINLVETVIRHMINCQRIYFLSTKQKKRVRSWRTTFFTQNLTSSLFSYWFSSGTNHSAFLRPSAWVIGQKGRHEITYSLLNSLSLLLKPGLHIWASKRSITFTAGLWRWSCSCLLFFWRLSVVTSLSLRHEHYSSRLRH